MLEMEAELTVGHVITEQDLHSLSKKETTTVRIV